MILLFLMFLWVGWAGLSQDSSCVCSIWCWLGHPCGCYLDRRIHDVTSHMSGPPSWDGCKPEACLSLVLILKDFFPFMVIHLPWPLLPCDLSSMIVQTALHGGLVLHKRERASRPLNLVRELEKHHIYHILLVKASNRSVQIQSGRGQYKGMNTRRWYWSYCNNLPHTSISYQLSHVSISVKTEVEHLLLLFNVRCRRCKDSKTYSKPIHSVMNSDSL